MLPGASGLRWMPRKMAGIAMITIDASMVAIVTLSVVLDSATHLYRPPADPAPPAPVLAAPVLAAAGPAAVISPPARSLPAVLRTSTSLPLISCLIATT